MHVISRDNVKYSVGVSIQYNSLHEFILCLIMINVVRSMFLADVGRSRRMSELHSFNSLQRCHFIVQVLPPSNPACSFYVCCVRIIVSVFLSLSTDSISSSHCS